MRSPHITTIRVLLWGLCASFASPPVYGARIVQTQMRVVISFAMSTPAVSLHEPVYVEFSVHNGSSEPIELELGMDRKSNFDFAITEARGRIARPPHLREAGVGASGRVFLSPGGTDTEKLLLNEWYQFLVPGNYKVEAKLVGAIRTQSGITVETNPSQELDVRVGPRNPERLEEVCRSLAWAAVDSSSSDWRVAMLALSNVPDAIAVPFLEQVALQSEPLRGTAIAGLGRIANVQGIDKVIASLKTKDPLLESEIRTELYAIKHGVEAAD